MYDFHTIQRLRWVHGDVRASRIVIGEDNATDADIASWKRLGGRTPTSLDQRFDTAVKLVAQGYSVEDAAFMADVSPWALTGVIAQNKRP